MNWPQKELIRQIQFYNLAIEIKTQIDEIESKFCPHLWIQNQKIKLWLILK